MTDEKLRKLLSELAKKMTPVQAEVGGPSDDSPDHHWVLLGPAKGNSDNSESEEMGEGDASE